MAAPPIKTALVVGTGVIGASWATLFLSKGLRVICTDPDPAAEERLRQFVSQSWAAVERLGTADGASPDKIEFTQDVAAAAKQADWVQENGPEKVEFKRSIFKQLDAVAPAHAIFASSSSGIPSSQYADAAEQHPGRILVGHPFNPPHLVPLVEVVPGKLTSDDTVQRALEFYKSFGKDPILIRKEVKGFAANRLQAAVYREAFSLVLEGVLSPREVDAAISHGPGLRWAFLGPFMSLHLAGGEGGFPHLLDHLGGAIMDWVHDFKPVELDDASKTTLVQAMKKFTDEINIPAMTKDRDSLLIDLMNAKETKDTLP